LLLWALLGLISGRGQSARKMIEAEISGVENRALASEMTSFYESVTYKTGWYFSGSIKDQWMACKQQAAYWGIDSSYFTGSVKDLLTSPSDTLKEEAAILRRMLLFCQEFFYGKPPDFGYDGILYQPSCLHPGSELARAVNDGQLIAWINDHECRSIEYLALKDKLRWYADLLRDGHYQEHKLTKQQLSPDGALYIGKLWSHGLYGSPAGALDSSSYQQSITDWQELFYFPHLKSIEPALLKEMNVPVRTRIRELSDAMAVCRWLDCFRKSNSEWIVVNVPSASLRYYFADTVALHSKVVVGKSSTRTPLLASRITDIVLFPYWLVPDKIAVKELLPLIQRNRSYLEANNFEVLDRNGRLVNPDAINWQSMGPDNFPYKLRQSTGCDNSLGIIKINFYSPFSVYLHDTPYRTFFAFYKRYYSHGCIRVEKAQELAGMLLKDRKSQMDSLIANAAPRDQQPFSIALPARVPLMVIYQSAWIDENNQVRFYGDVYNKSAR